MAWNSIVTSDVVAEGAIISQEFSAYTNVILHGNLSNTTQNLINNIIFRARFYIGSNLKVVTPLGPDGTVPDEARMLCMACIVWGIICAIPTADDKILNTRRKSYEDACKALEELKNGTLFIIQAPADTQAAAQPTLPTRAGLASSGVFCPRPPCLGGFLSDL